MRKVVLLVDDDESARLVHSHAFRQLSWDVVVAEDGADVPALILERRFDLLVIDLYMPGMNGLEVLRQVRRPTSVSRTRSMTSPQVPILVVSAESNPASIANAKAIGADAYLIKPPSFDMLENTVGALLKRRPAAGGASSSPAKRKR